MYNQTNTLINMDGQVPLLELKDLSVRHLKKRAWFGEKQWLDILKKINLQIFAGEIVGLAGESGCGKSTLAQAIMGLSPITSGKIYYQQQDLTPQPRKIRDVIQLVFQDSTSALNPRQTTYDCMAEAIQSKNNFFQKQNKEKLRHEVVESIKIVGLNAQHLSMYPHSLSGGQRQRLCIARAICRQPKILICDEITSALDVSTQTQIIELLLHLKKQFKLALLWISHDFSIIEYFCDRLYIMDDGKIIEEGDCLQLLRSPKHPRVQEFVTAASTLLE